MKKWSEKLKEKKDLPKVVKIRGKKYIVLDYEKSLVSLS